MEEELVQIQEIDVPQIDFLYFDHPNFHNHVITLEFGVIIVLEVSSTSELHQVQDELTFKYNEKTLDLLITIFPETIVIVLSLDLILESDKFWETTNLRIELHWDRVQDLHLHL